MSPSPSIEFQRICTSSDAFFKLPVWKRATIYTVPESQIRFDLQQSAEAGMCAIDSHDALRLRTRRIGRLISKEFSEATLPVTLPVAHAVIGNSGRPVPDSYYVVHPADDCRYIPLASFAADISAGHIVEFQRLCLALGASEVAIEDNRSGNVQQSIQGNTTVDSDAQGTGKGQVRLERSHDFELSRLALFSGSGHGRPKIPEGLTWMHLMPEWQALAEARLRFGVEKYEVSFRSASEHLLSGQLSAEVRTSIWNASCSLSGKSAWRQERVFQFKLRFPPLV